MSTVLTANNAVSRLAASLSAASTTFGVMPGEGVKFPAPTAGQWFPVTLVKADGALEIMKCTGRTLDSFTVVRAQEGTQALAFAPGDRVELRLTKACVDSILAEIATTNNNLATTNNNLDTTNNNLAALEGDVGVVMSTGFVVYAGSGTRTFAVPEELKSGKKKARVIVTGGGGGGSGSTGSTIGSGGGGGGTGVALVDLSGVTSVTCTVGSGGNGGIDNSSDGVGLSGGASSFGTYVSAAGGGGAWMYSANSGGIGGGASSTGGLSLYGADGSIGASGRGGTGGASYWGGGGRYDGFFQNRPSRVYGSGGHGAAASGKQAGRGADGVIVIEW